MIDIGIEARLDEVVRILRDIQAKIDNKVAVKPSITPRDIVEADSGEPMTEGQSKFIFAIKKNLGVRFEGSTKLQARQFINQYAGKMPAKNSTNVDKEDNGPPWHEDPND